MYRGWYPIGASSHFEEGMRLKEKGDFDNAIKEFSEAIRLCPEYIEAYFWLGCVYYEKGMIDEALNVYKTGIEKYSGDREAVECLISLNILLADILYEHRRFDEACHYYEKVLSHCKEEGIMMLMPFYYDVYSRYLETKGKPLFDINEEGDTEERAVKIRNAPDEIIGVTAEHDYLARKFSDKKWQIVKQELFEKDDRTYDRFFLEFSDGSIKIVYFDITDFFGKPLFQWENWKIPLRCPRHDCRSKDIRFVEHRGEWSVYECNDCGCWFMVKETETKREISIIH